MSFPYLIELLNTSHNRESFDCGESTLNDFLKRFARQNDEKGLGRTFVAVAADNPAVKGYYTLSNGAVKFDNVPEKLPRYPIPVAHLGRLAVDVSARGQGLGEYLLLDALSRIADVAGQIGIYAVEVYALNEQAKSFYLKYGFRPLLDDPLHLYLPMKTVRKLKLI
jgi:ribosomal protein S18 acetylase RimI-like enzyme